MTTLSTFLQALGVLTLAILLMGVSTSRRWEPALLRWLERRRREREAKSYRTAFRRTYVG